MRQRLLTTPKNRYRTTSATVGAASVPARGLNRAAMDLDDVVSGLGRSAHLAKIGPLRDDAAQLRRQVTALRDRAQDVNRG